MLEMGVLEEGGYLGYGVKCWETENPCLRIGTLRQALGRLWGTGICGASDS